MMYVILDGLDKSIRMKQTIANLDSFDMDKLFNDVITNHNKKVDLNHVKYDLKQFLINNFTQTLHPN